MELWLFSISSFLFLYSTWTVSGVCVWGRGYGCASVCVRVNMAARGWQGLSFSITLHLTFKNRVSHRTWSSQSRVGWPCGELQGAMGLYLPNAEIMSLRCYTGFWQGCRMHAHVVMPAQDTLSEPSPLWSPLSTVSKCGVPFPVVCLIFYWSHTARYTSQTLYLSVLKNIHLVSLKTFPNLA